MKIPYRYLQIIEDNANWEKLSMRRDLPESFIEKYWDKLDLTEVLYFSKVSEEFLDRHSLYFFKTFDDEKNKKVLSAITVCQKVSEKFIEKYLVHYPSLWFHISAKQKLSEEFMEKYKDQLNWRMVSIYQKLSQEFVEKFIKFVDLQAIIKYQTHLSTTFLKRIKDEYKRQESKNSYY